MQRALDLIEMDIAADHPDPIVGHGHIGRLLRVVAIGEFADHFLGQVFAGDDLGEAAMALSTTHASSPRPESTPARIRERHGGGQHQGWLHDRAHELALGVELPRPRTSTRWTTPTIRFTIEHRITRRPRCAIRSCTAPMLSPLTHDIDAGARYHRVLHILPEVDDPIEQRRQLGADRSALTRLLDDMLQVHGRRRVFYIVHRLHPQDPQDESRRSVEDQINGPKIADRVVERGEPARDSGAAGNRMFFKGAAEEHLDEGREEQREDAPDGEGHAHTCWRCRPSRRARHRSAARRHNRRATLRHGDPELSPESMYDVRRVIWRVRSAASSPAAASAVS